MVSIILAAGYATRLYPLTKNFPKPLLKIGELNILDRIISDLDTIPEIHKHVVVSNHSFISHFENWKANSSFKKPIEILDDGTTNNENRLGAVKDILFAIDSLDIQDDVIVLAGDNVFDFSFKGFVDYALDKKTSCITCHFESSITALQKTGVLETNDSFKVIAMHEKPKVPPSNFAVPPFYIYRREDLPLLKKALDEGCGYDAPGNLASWLCKKVDMYAFELKGKRYDIGDLASYEAVNKLFQ